MAISDRGRVKKRLILATRRGQMRKGEAILRWIDHNICLPYSEIVEFVCLMNGLDPYELDYMGNLRNRGYYSTNLNGSWKMFGLLEKHCMKSVLGWRLKPVVSAAFNRNERIQLFFRTKAGIQDAEFWSKQRDALLKALYEECERTMKS